jgi:hypothetical protein
VTDTDAGPAPLDEDSYFRDATAYFGRVRESQHPVAQTRLPGFNQRRWFIPTRYEDVREAFTDPRLANDLQRFPGGPLTRPSAEAGGVHAHLLNNDPPVHTRMRRLVQKTFTPRSIARLRPHAEETARALLDAMDAAGGTADLIKAYAEPLPGAVLCELLGIPQADREWILSSVTSYGTTPERSAQTTEELAAYLNDRLADKRARPREDLLSGLATVRDDVEEDGSGAGLTETEARSLAFQIIMGGFDTVVNLIANGTLALLTHPGELARLRADPSVFPAAIEELLRFTYPFRHSTDRFTTEEVTIGGVTVPPGEWVTLAISSANRDPRRFPDPDRLDLTRDTSGHFAFGHGIHYCLGAFLARMEAEVALRALLDRFPNLSLAVPEGELRWRRVSLTHGLESLPLRLS